MIEVRRILCPVDLSACSRHALDHAVAIARWYGASVSALYVFATIPVVGYAPGVAGFPAVVLTPEDRDEVLAALRQFISVDGRCGVAIDIVTREGDAAREILAHADDLQADLLVLGTHGRSGFQRLVLGSVAEKVLRRADCPVLSVPPHAGGPSRAPAYEKILCPVDFSDPAMQALRYAASLAEEARAQLTVMHVMQYDAHEAPEFYETIVSSDHLPAAELRQRARTIARERLDDAIADDVRARSRAQTLLSDGKPYREILRVAAAEQSDLIVIGVRGRSGADLALFGSTTQHVVRLAACPVMTLRGR